MTESISEPNPPASLGRLTDVRSDLAAGELAVILLVPALAVPLAYLVALLLVGA